MKAVKRFKQMLFKRRPELMESIFGSTSRIVQPPMAMRQHSAVLVRSRSEDTSDRRPIEGALTSEGIHRDIDIHCVIGTRLLACLLVVFEVTDVQAGLRKLSWPRLACWRLRMHDPDCN